MKPLAIIIMDGFGISSKEEYNAVARAKKPNLERFWKNYPTTTHAKTIEFNITRKDNLAALFQSVNKAWISGKGVKFTIRKE